MKQSARKLLSLLMAFAIVLSLAPWALAADSPRVTGTITPASATIYSNGTAGTDSVKLQATVSSSLVDGPVRIISAGWKVNEGGEAVEQISPDVSTEITIRAKPNLTRDVAVTVGATITYEEQSLAGADTSWEKKTVEADPVTITVKKAPAAAEVQGITFAPSNSIELISGGEGASVTATVRGTGLDETNNGVTWSGWERYSEYVTVTTNGNTITVTPKTVSERIRFSILATSKAHPTKSAQLSVNIDPWRVNSVILDHTALNIPVTSTNTTLTAQISGVSGAEATIYSIKWTSDNPQVAAVPSERTYFSATSSGLAQTTAKITPVSAGTTRIRARLYYGDNAVYNEDAICEVTVTSDGTFTLNPASVNVSYQRATNYTVSPVLNNWTSAYSIDWYVTNGTGSALICDTLSSSLRDWKTSVTTRRTTVNGAIPGVYVYGETTGTATLAAILRDSSGRELGRASIPVTVGAGTNVLTPSASSITVPYNAWSNYFYVTSSSAVNGYRVRWSVPANQSFVSISETGVGSTGLYTVDTYVSSSNNRTGIYLYGIRSGYTTTLTATLYDRNGSQLGTSLQIPVTVGNTTGFTLVPTPSNTGAIYLDEYWSGSASGYYRDFSVDPRLNGSSIHSTSANRLYDVYYTWTLNGYTVQTTSNSNIYRLYSSNQYLNNYLSSSNRYNTLTCTVAVYNRGAQVTTANRLYSNSVSWNIYTGNNNSRFSVYATVYDSNPGYALTDTPDEGNTGSIASQIDTWVRNNYYYYGSSSNYYRDYQVHITGGTAYESGSSGNRGTLTSGSSNTWYSYSDLDRVVFTPGSYVSTSTGSYQISYGFEVRLYNYSGGTASDTVYGTMIFTVKQGTTSGGDISYSGERGKDVTFDASDFERFWTNRYSGGSLSHVTFGTPTGTPGGTVYDSSSRAVGSRDYYVNPSRSENDLNGVYFSPKNATAGTTRIPFTATGRTRSNSTSTTATLRGTIIITYLSSAANKITYATTSNGTVNLKASDFTSAYREVTGKSAPSNLTIVFQDVPSNGTLTYTDSSRSNASAVRLTSSNIRSRNFTTKSSGSNQLEDVTYTGSNGRTDTISYIAYTGTTAVFTGEVTFNTITTPLDVNVYYTCYSAAGISLTPANFTSANSAMANASYVILGTPRTGKLTYNAGPTSAAILMNLLGGVTYTPSTASAGTATTDTFTFRAFNSANTLVASGTVNVTVSLPANTPKPGAITNISQLTDIPAPGVASDWYRPQLTFLINKGVINGKGDGKFGPGDDLAYSEALKFIMNAAGYYETELTGANWAENYRSRAVQNGWLSSNVNVNSKITRDAMAELTAKVLGIPASTKANPFSDSTNQWAAALYEKKIVQGTTSGSKPSFSGNTMLKRSEMVCLVYNMYQYKAAN